MGEGSIFLDSLLAGLLFASAAQTDGKSLEKYDCGIEQYDEDRKWAVEEIGHLRASWRLTASAGLFVSSSVLLRDEAEADSYLSGSFDPSPYGGVSISTWRDIPRDGAWMTLSGNGKSTGPIYFNLHQQRHFNVNLERVLFIEMASGTENIALMVQSKTGAVLFEEELPSSVIRDTEETLVSLVREVENNRMDREERCAEVILVAH